MYPNEYQLHEHTKDLLRQAEQQRLVREAESQRVTLSQRAGQTMLMLGAKLAVERSEGCYLVERAGQVVTVCPA